MSQFAFYLGDEVVLFTNERGRIRARAEYTYMSNMYLVQYQAADGRAVESWWDEQSLKKA